MSPLAGDLHGALAELRAHSPRARLVVITGSTSGIPQALEPESFRWVRKPFEVGEVVDALTRESPSPAASSVSIVMPDGEVASERPRPSRED